MSVESYQLAKHSDSSGVRTHNHLVHKRTFKTKFG